MRRARAQDGFSLVEVMLAAALGLVLLCASLMTLERAFTISAEVGDRVDAVQRARTAMDVMTRQLRSAVCPDPLTAALIGGSDDSVAFFVDLGDGSMPVAKHVLTYDASARTISEARFDGIGASPATTWPASPSATRILLDNVGRSGSDPVFRFNAFDAADPPRPSLVLPTPLSSASVAAASRITITFDALPAARTGSAKQSTALQDQVDLRSADPNQPKPAPQCT